MGHQNDGTAFGIQFLEQHENFFFGFAVKVSGWLVGKNNFRVIHQGLGNGNALLLPSRQLKRAVIEAVCQPHAYRQLFDTLMIFPR